MSTLRSTAGTWTCGTNPVKCTRLPNRCARRASAGRSGPSPTTSSCAPAGSRANASSSVPTSFLRRQPPQVGDPRPGQAGKRIRRRRGEQGRVVAGRDHVHAAGRYPVAAQQPRGRRGQRDHCGHAGQQPPPRRVPGRPQHHAARCGRAQRMPHAQVHGGHHRAAVAQRREPSQRQHGHILAAMHMDQIHPPGAQHMPHRQRRPALPQHRYPQAGPDHLAVSPEPDPVRGPGPPRCHHQLANAQPVQAPGQLSGVVLHPRSGRRPPRPASDRAARKPNTGAAPAACRSCWQTAHPGAAASGQPAAPRRPARPRHWPSPPRQPAPARDLAERRRSRCVPPYTDPAWEGEQKQNWHWLMHTARLLSPEHTEEYRVVPARQHTGMSRSVAGPGRSLPDNIRRSARHADPFRSYR
jgi:hypothetical protein